MKFEARKQHLTDVEFGDLLAGGVAGGRVEAHLAACDHCRRELEAVQGSLGSFRALSTAWATAAAPVRVPVPSRFALRLTSLPSWGAGLAVTALTGVLSFGLNLPSLRSHVDVATAAPATVVPSKAELAEDNRLMLSIDEELSYRAQPVAPTTDVHADARRDTRRPAASVLD